MADTIPQISVLWDYIGSAWADFQDKQLVEGFWSSMGNGIQLLYDNVGNMQTSRTISLMNPTFDYGPQRFIIAYSGVLPAYVTSSGTNIQIPPVTTLYQGTENITNGGFEINTSGWILSTGVVRSSAQAHTGSQSLLLPAGNAQATYTWPSRIYPPSHFEMWVYVPTGGSLVGAQLLNAGNVVASLFADPSKINQWQKVSSDHLTSAITDVMIFSQATSVGNGITYIDDVSLSNTYKFAFQIDEWTYSIPTIEYNYRFNGTSYSGVYTQGVDYVINNSLNNILWVGGNPIADKRYAGIGVINGVAPHIYRINPVLANVWCRAIGLSAKTQYPSYMTFGQNKYLHLKMFAWACSTHKRAVPSIYTYEMRTE